MRHLRVPTELPLRHPLEKRLAAGKDNRVYTVREVGSVVIKAGNGPHNPENGGTSKAPFTAEIAINDALYKQAKYRLLRTFLGDYIPRTSFFVGSQRNPDGQTAIKPYSVQQRVPNITFGDLSPEQRNNDDLRGNMYHLTQRLQVMHQTLNRAQRIVKKHDNEFLVDATLDLGPFSDYVKGHVDEDPRSFNYKEIINGYKSSPNLLVDPEDNMALYCVDFGSGSWNEDLMTQMTLVYDLATYDPEISSLLPLQTSSEQL
jgi:hypothetical protein